MEEIIRKLLGYFKENKIKGTEIAEILGLKKSPLTDWKNGHSKPTIEQLITICEKLALSLDELTGINKNDIQAAYDKADPAIQEAVRKLLDIEIEKTTIKELEEEHELIKLDEWKKKHHLT